MDLRTTYLGLELSHPIVASASPLTASFDGMRRLEDAGAAADRGAHGALAHAPARGRSSATSTMWELAEVRLGTSRELNSQ